MSGEPVFLVEQLPAPGEFELVGDEGRHAATVLRLRAGERLILTDGRGARAPATVTATGRGTLTVTVVPATIDPAPAVRVTLVQALAKGDRSELSVDLATEAGVDEIIPWQAQRCVARWTGSPDKAERGRAKWESTARAAAKQSRRSRVPVIRPLASTDDVVSAMRAADLTLVLQEDGAVPLPAVQLPAAGELWLIVGPEGGLSPGELDRFTAAGARAVRLGPEVLRTSTAAAVALGAIAVMAGRWTT